MEPGSPRERRHEHEEAGPVEVRVDARVDVAGVEDRLCDPDVPPRDGEARHGLEDRRQAEEHEDENHDEPEEHPVRHLAAHQRAEEGHREDRDRSVEGDVEHGDQAEAVHPLEDDVPQRESPEGERADGACGCGEVGRTDSDRRGPDAGARPQRYGRPLRDLRDRVPRAIEGTLPERRRAGDRPYPGRRLYREPRVCHALEAADDGARRSGAY